MAVNVKEIKPYVQLLMSLLEPRILKSDNKLDDLGLVSVQVWLESEKWLTACQAAIDSGVPVEKIVANLRGMIEVKP